MLMLESHQIEMETKKIVEEDLIKEIRLQNDLHVACRKEAEMWRQKARCHWLKDGDRNTSFFHKQAEARKNFKTMNEIHVHNNVIQDFGDIKVKASRHFSEIYTADPINNSENDLMELVPRIVKRKDNERLTQRVMMEEIKDVVYDMEDDKAPGPDGFNANFIKVC